MDSESQEKIRGNFRQLYLDIKSLTNNQHENQIPKLKQGRELVTEIDLIERNKYSLEKEQINLANALEAVDKKINSRTGSFFPCLIARERTALMLKIQTTDQELARAILDLENRHNIILKLHEEILPLKFQLEHPIRSRPGSLVNVYL